jgi:methylated-DNA-protein-cysteine methyltransferase-like protein
MEERLRAEGVTFLEDGRVDLSGHLWDPADAMSDERLASGD